MRIALITHISLSMEIIMHQMSVIIQSIIHLDLRDLQGLVLRE